MSLQFQLSGVHTSVLLGNFVLPLEVGKYLEFCVFSKERRNKSERESKRENFLVLGGVVLCCTASIRSFVLNFASIDLLQQNKMCGTKIIFRTNICFFFLTDV